MFDLGILQRVSVNATAGIFRDGGGLSFISGLATSGRHQVSGTLAR